MNSKFDERKEESDQGNVKSKVGENATNQSADDINQKLSQFQSKDGVNVEDGKKLDLERIQDSKLETVDNVHDHSSQIKIAEDLSRKEKIESEASKNDESKPKMDKTFNEIKDKNDTSAEKPETNDVAASNQSVDDAKNQPSKLQTEKDICVKDDVNAKPNKDLNIKRDNKGDESEDSRQNRVSSTMSSNQSQELSQGNRTESLTRDLSIPRFSSDALIEPPSMDTIPRCKSCDLSNSDMSVTVTKFFGLIKVKKSLENFTEIWLISVPKEDDTIRKLNDKTVKGNFSQNFKFHVPVLKIGTMDSLMKLTEELPSLDKFVFEITHKLAYHLKNDLQEKGQDFDETFKVASLSPLEYMIKFSWNFQKFPSWHSILKISKMLHVKADEISKCFARKLNTWGFLNTNLMPYESRSTSSLHKRYLGDIVKEENFVVGSKFLETLLVVVPNNRIKEWLKSYHTFCDMVVPNSSEKIFADKSHSLFNVTVAKKHRDTFENNAREKMFMVRKFSFSEEKLKSEKVYYENLIRVKTRQKAALFRWVKINFAECFEAWTHVKALMIFVESVLRFGLPVNYEAMLLVPLKSRKKLRRVLDGLYENADLPLAKGHIDKVPGALASYKVDDYYPYVYFHVDLDFIYCKR